MNKTPRERIEILLKIHGGRCFIVATCEDFAALEAAVKEMEQEKLVAISPSVGLAGLVITRKGWRPKNGPVEPEEPAH